ncbi:hypothetical protein [Ascidiimonas aurantiaca]|uniref:hypothetical protein n=1 Tax=Ascidiimonas aurantiaca TaxID=1685432 RepID=UPI0030EBF8BC
MIVSEFTYLLQHPASVDPGQTAELEKVIEAYPYFQSARALHLKGLKAIESFKYNQALKKTAAHTTDRSILFDFITSEVFNQNEIAGTITKQALNLKNIPVNIEEVGAKAEQEVKEEDLGSKEEASAVLNPELFKPKDGNDQNREKALRLGKPLEFSPDEKHSFTEWLKLSALQPVERDTPEAAKSAETSAGSRKNWKFALIDKFIDNNPKIVPSKEAAASVNLAKEQTLEKSELMTETLARVYLEQRKYKKAIQAYKILSLKYPEKSGFFADQIRAIMNLQQNK